MSAGVFANYAYIATYNPQVSHPIRVQPETLQLSPTAVIDTTPTSPISARVSAGKRTKGLVARSVSLRLAIGADPPAGYSASSTTRIPVLTPTDYNALNVGGLVTYLGVQWQVIGKSPEIAR